MRTLVADVTLLPEPDFSRARIGVRWHTGAADELVVARSQAVTEYRRTDRGAVELARRLADLPNAEVAQELNSAGYKTGAGRHFDRMAVANMRHYHKIPQPDLLKEGELTVAEVARRLGIRHESVIYWIARGWLPARPRPERAVVRPVRRRRRSMLRERVARSAHVHEPDSTEPQGANELSIGEVAPVLGISTNVVYYWAERHYVEARRAPGGRLFVKFGKDVEAAGRERIAASVHLPPRRRPSMGTSDCDNGAYGTGTAPSTGLRDASVEPDRTGFSCPTCGRFIVTVIEGGATPSTVRPGGSVTMPAGKRRTVAGVPMCQRPRPYSAKEVVAGGSTPARVNKTLSPRTPNPTRHYEETQYEATVPVIVDRVRQAQVVNALEPEW